jgi:hypothetical protein
MAVLDLPSDLTGSAASLFGDGEGATAGSGFERRTPTCISHTRGFPETPAEFRLMYLLDQDAAPYSLLI